MEQEGKQGLRRRVKRAQLLSHRGGGCGKFQIKLVGDAGIEPATPAV
jgi:hypothetical protein